MKIIELFVAKDGHFFENEEDCLVYENKLGNEESPYIYKQLNSLSQEKQFNPKYDNDATCQCGHPYYRHFDSYENNDPVGCKYCGCYDFTLAKEDNKEKIQSNCSCEHHST